MSEHEPLDAGLKSTEAMLAQLMPVGGRIDRDRLMYEAGRAASARSPWRQIAATSLVAVVALVAGRFSAPQMAAIDGRSTVIAQAPAIVSSANSDRLAAATHERSSVFRLRRHVEQIDVGVPSHAVEPVGPRSRGELMHELLN